MDSGQKGGRKRISSKGSYTKSHVLDRADLWFKAKMIQCSYKGQQMREKWPQ